MRVEAVFDAFEQPVSVFRTDGVYAYINAPGLALLGRSSRELIGRRYLDLYPDLVGHPYHAAFERVASGASRAEELEFFYEPMQVWSSQRLYRIDDHVVVLWENITSRKNVEAQLRAALSGAAESVAREQAASRAKDEFLAVLGHELRNPLAPIQTALEVIRLRGAGTREREHAVIERQVRHMVRLVDDLLDVARITRGKIDLSLRRLDVADIVSRAVEMVSPLLEQRQHAVTVAVPRGLVVSGDEDRLAQVVSNLLTNAARYTPAHGRVTIVGARVDAEVTLCVTDDGVGIGPDLLPQVFEVFVQGRQAIDRPLGGLGLGLAIVRRLVELHGGRVAAQSDGVGRGATFRIHLPALDGDAPKAIEAAPATVATTRSRGQRVLVVDDNEDAVEMLSALLVSAGHAAQTACDGPSALEVSARFCPDVALLDIGLPVMDGYELARRLRALPGHERVRLIAVTGYSQESAREHTREAGFDEHLVKPIDAERLLAALAPSGDG